MMGTANTRSQSILDQRKIGIDFLRANRASNIGIAIIIAISSALLTTLAEILYDIWVDAQAQSIAQGADGIALSGTAVFYEVIMLFACIAIMLIIKSAFDASMLARTHQLGILATVGATPKQLKTLLIKDALATSVAPLLIGIAIGTYAGYLLVNFFIDYATRLQGLERIESSFLIDPLVLIAIGAIVLLTIFLSALVPARKLARTTPLQAINSPSLELNAVKKRKKARAKKSRIPHSSAEWVLAKGSFEARRSALRSSSVAFGVSFLIFILFLSFITISKLSVEETYYERFGIEWDLAINVADSTPDDLAPAEAVLGEAGWIVRTDSYDEGARLYVQSTVDEPLDEQRAALARLIKEHGITTFDIITMDEDRAYADAVWDGYLTIVGSFCAILALIGIASIVAQAISFTQQRRREFSRYRSIGMTPRGVCKMLFFEGLLSVVRPLVFALIPVVVCTIALASLGKQTLSTFALAFPYGIALIYLAAVAFCVLAAYALGAWRLNKMDIARAIRDDSLM
jgi:ABC-type antimicrobial peptide transport system permease subunit